MDGVLSFLEVPDVLDAATYFASKEKTIRTTRSTSPKRSEGKTNRNAVITGRTGNATFSSFFFKNKPLGFRDPPQQGGGLLQEGEFLAPSSSFL